MMAQSVFVPDFRIEIDGERIPAAMRASTSSVTLDQGFDGADRVDMSIANPNLRWLDNPLLRMDHEFVLSLGYAQAPPTQVFSGNIVAVAATFPQSGGPAMTVTAQDRRQKLKQGKKVRWFAIPVPMVGNFPLPDIATASLVTLENIMLPIMDPVGAAIAVLIGGIEMVSSIADPGTAQKFIRKQANESDYDFLAKIARENGWDMYVDHSGPLGGRLLRFQSSLDNLEPDVTLRYGRSLVDFAPRITAVGQIISVTGYVWVPQIKMVFNITVGFDWDRMALTLMIYPGVVPLGQAAGENLIKDPLTPASAARRLIGEIIPRLNRRLTASGTCIGDPRIKPGGVLRIEGVGEQFGGLYRVTSVQHSIGNAGYHTRFELRKEIWFGSIPPADQGALPIRIQGERIAI
jgi:hypothetical protein